MMDQVHSSAPRADAPAAGSKADAAPTDKELLEKAAKAAGMPHKWIPLLGKMVHIIDGGRSEEWNPLTDDGDALRLAVKLRLCISHDECECCAWCSPGLDSMGDGDACVIERMHNAGSDVELQDRATATRRAIVRAAAEIGRAGDSVLRR